MNPQRLILPVYLVIMAVLVLATASWFIEARAEYRQLKQTEAASRQALADARARLAEQEKILERLRNDPEFVEKVIRKRLGYGKPGEVIFRFEN